MLLIAAFGKISQSPKNIETEKKEEIVWSWFV